VFKGPDTELGAHVPVERGRVAALLGVAEHVDPGGELDGKKERKFNSNNSAIN
jgi:hypothetical protein